MAPHQAEDREYWERNRYGRMVAPPLLADSPIPRFISADSDRYVTSYYEYRRRESEYEHKLLRWTLDRIGEHLHAPASITFLDVGMGLGAFHEQIAQAYPTVSITGIDLEPDGVRVAQKWAPASAQYHRADACHLPFADETFDIVFSKNAVEHAGAPMIAEMYRVQRREGVSLLIGPGYVSHLTTNPIKLVRALVGLDPDVHGYRVAQYRSFVAQAGFQIRRHDAFCFNFLQRNVMQRWARNERLPLPPRLVVHALFGFNDLIERTARRMGWKALLWMQAFELHRFDQKLVPSELM